ncbi:MAG: hypothetical protein U9Q78_00890 [Chloroflexota bacterium]|nr:hypothetical protein [Chloroflexota bacterium]
MQWQSIPAAVIWISRISYLVLVTFYFALILLAILLTARQALVRVIAFILRRRTRPDQTSPISGEHSFLGRTKAIFETSFVANATLAIVSVLLPFVLISELSLQTSIRLFLATLIVTVIPYVWGFTRMSGVGIISGAIGAMLGLFWLSSRDPRLVWWDLTPYFLSLNLLANLSGWLGGFLGIGQVREAAAISVFEIELGSKGSFLFDLIHRVQKAIHEEFVATTAGKLTFTESNLDLVITQTAEDEARCSLTSFRREMEWRRGRRPQLVALRWLFERGLNVHSVDDILDHVFNVWRYTATKAVFAREPDHSSDDNRLLIAVLTYKETTTIIWADEEVALLSLRLFKRICNALEMDAVSRKGETRWRLKKRSSTILRRWQPRPRLEQYVKNTTASNSIVTFMGGSQLDPRADIPRYVSDQFLLMPSLFDKLRGRLSTFVVFLLTQIIVGILIDCLANQLMP